MFVTVREHSKAFGSEPKSLPHCWHSCAQGRRATSGKSFLFNLTFENKRIKNNFGSGTMYDNVATHAWSPPNFPHSEEEAKATTASKCSVGSWRNCVRKHRTRP